MSVVFGSVSSMGVGSQELICSIDGVCACQDVLLDAKSASPGKGIEKKRLKRKIVRDRRALDEGLLRPPIFQRKHSL